MQNWTMVERLGAGRGSQELCIGKRKGCSQQKTIKEEKARVEREDDAESLGIESERKNKVLEEQLPDM